MERINAKIAQLHKNAQDDVIEVMDIIQTSEEEKRSQLPVRDILKTIIRDCVCEESVHFRAAHLLLSLPNISEADMEFVHKHLPTFFQSL